MFYVSAADQPEYHLKKIVTIFFAEETGTGECDPSICFYSSQKNLGSSTRKSNSNAWNHIFTHLQTSATRSEWKLLQGTETTAALEPPRECTKAPISAFPNIGSMEKFRAINRA